MIKPYLVISILIFSFSGNAQIIIEPLPDCIAHIKTYHYEKVQKETAALAIYKESKWYNWLPKPGLGYDFISGRPMFTLGAPDYISFINRQKELKYRISKANQTAAGDLHADTVAFISGYHELQTLIQLYHREALLIAHDSTLLNLKKEENKKLQATTEDVLKQKMAFLEKKYTHDKSILAIMTKAASLEPYLHRNLKIQYNLAQ